MNKKYIDLINDQKNKQNKNLIKQINKWEQVSKLPQYKNLFFDVSYVMGIQLELIKQKRGIFKDCQNVDDFLVELEKLILRKWSRHVQSLNFEKYENFDIFELKEELIQKAKWECEAKDYAFCTNILNLNFIYLKYEILKMYMKRI